MTKEEFLQRYRTNRQGHIRLGEFYDDVFLHDPAVVLEEKTMDVSLIGNWFCPWFHKNGVLVEWQMAFADPEARAIRVKEIVPFGVYADSEANMVVKEPVEISDPFPVAIDGATGLSLILDGTHRLCALYKSGNKIDVPVIFIRHPSMEKLIGDFRVVKRSVKS